eukprot:790772-Alexandrium_andersonii.AAC.1
MCGPPRLSTRGTCSARAALSGTGRRRIRAPLPDAAPRKKGLESGERLRWRLPPTAKNKDNKKHRQPRRTVGTTLAGRLPAA